MTDITIVTFDITGLALTEGTVTVYNYDHITREYLSPTDEYFLVGVGIPAHAALDNPLKIKKGFAICRTPDLSAWEYVPDHRAETVYSTETGQLITISVLGDYPANTTTKPPATRFDKWNGTAWILDKNAQTAATLAATEEQKSTLLAEAQSAISIWQTELQLDVINDEDKAQLILWLSYIKALKAVNTAVPVWPLKPEDSPTE